MDKFLSYALIAIIVAVLLVVVSSLMAYPHMWLFNVGIASVFGFEPINYQQSFCLFLYLSIFLTGLRSSGSSKYMKVNKQNDRTILHFWNRTSVHNIAKMLGTDRKTIEKRHKELIKQGKWRV